MMAPMVYLYHLYPNFLSADEVQKLRNMIEFFDSTNNPEFKLHEHVVFPENR